MENEENNTTDEAAALPEIGAENKTPPEDESEMTPCEKLAGFGCLALLIVAPILYYFGYLYAVLGVVFGTGFLIYALMRIFQFFKKIITKPFANNRSAKNTDLYDIYYQLEDGGGEFGCLLVPIILPITALYWWSVYGVKKYIKWRRYRKAFLARRAAAERGEVIAQFKLGNFYRKRGRKFAKALKWYRKAADQGHAAAQDAVYRIEEQMHAKK